MHLTRMMGGRVTVGPNAVLGFAREGYPHFSINLHDFMFADTPRTVHVLNAPSPAATAALPIARLIAARALNEAE